MCRERMMRGEHFAAGLVLQAWVLSLVMRPLLLDFCHESPNSDRAIRFWFHGVA